MSINFISNALLSCVTFSVVFFLRHLMVVFVFVPQEEKAMTLDSRMLWVLYSFKFVHFGCDVASRNLRLVANVPLCIVLKFHFLMDLNEYKDRTKMY